MVGTALWLCAWSPSFSAKNKRLYPVEEVRRCSSIYSISEHAEVMPLHLNSGRYEDTGNPMSDEVIDHDTWNYSPPKSPKAPNIKLEHFTVFCPLTALEPRSSQFKLP